MATVSSREFGQDVHTMPPLSDAEFQHLVGQLVEPVTKRIVEQGANRFFRWILGAICGGLAVAATIIMFAARLSNQVDGVTHRLDTLATAQQLESALNVYEDAVGDIVQSINRAKIKGLAIDQVEIDRKFNRGRARLSSLLPDWNIRNAVSAPAQRAFGNGAVLYAVYEKVTIRAPIKGEVTISNDNGLTSLTINGRTNLEAAAGLPFVQRPVYAAEKSQRVTLSGSLSSSVKPGENVQSGATIGEIAPPSGHMVAVLSLQYSVDGMALPAPVRLPVFDLGEEVFESQCQSCHGSARLVTPTEPDTPSLCNLPAKKLRNDGIPSFGNVLAAVRHERELRSLSPVSDEELQAVTAYLLRQSPAWGHHGLNIGNLKALHRH